MLKPQELVRDRLKEIERAFTAFERGDRNRLYDTRDSLLGLTSAIEGSDVSDLGPLSEIASRLLGLVIMEGGLTESRSVQVVRELLGFIEAQVMEAQPNEAPGGVFHIVNSEKVGDMLVRKGLISPDHVHKALLLQRVSKGRRLGQVLVAMNAIDQRTLDEVLEAQKAETRREETRRGSAGPQSQFGKRSIPLAPLPQLPGLSTGAPLPPMPQVQEGTHEEPPGGAGGAPGIPLAPLPAREPGLNAPGLSAPHMNDHQPLPRQGLNWLDGK
ncbi:hypothetical protein Poly30_09960 [Planctomycetes bacterium Poly30]|uniref:Uncharacterized protein n=1 Tax=Saltatorellus ferox TaxID=2528018 RepID=A0A518EN33_9BACT|nr:hypothetical protein Poly30_09960 [Planctomycetes bacterium Poly30]